MRACLLLVGLLLSLSSASAFPYGMQKRAPLITKSTQHPDAALTAVADFLNKRVLADDRPFFRFFWWGGWADARIVEDLTNWRVYLNTVNSETSIVRPFPVPGTGLALWGVDIRDLRWTAAAFSAVAHKDRVFTEPNCDHRLAETVRRLIGVQQDVTTFHVEAIVPGPWFTRAIMDPDGTETTAYYDLLYSVERFGADKGAKAVIPLPAAALIPPEPKPPAEVWWPGGVWQGEGPDFGKTFPPNAFQYTRKEDLAAYKKAHAEWERAKEALGNARGEAILPPGDPLNAKVLKDFPADLDQFQERWGIKANADFLDKQKIFVNKGEVVAGGRSDPKRGSYVAYQDRVIRILNGEFNNGGAGLSTQDFLRTSRGKNPANLPKEVVLGELEEDAGEHLVTLPNGLQAALLTNGAKAGRKRIDVADSRVAHSSLDPSDVTVRVSFSCVICHAAQDGVLTPANKKFGETLSRGIESFIYGKENQLKVRTFFEDSEWRMEIARVPYRRAVAQASAWGDVRPWTGKEWASATIAFRDAYDTPVTLDRATAELGYPKVLVLYACLKEGSIDAANLFMGEAVPRTVWDDDLQPRLALVLAALRDIDDPDPIVAVFFSDLLRQAAEKVEKKKKQP